MALNLFEHVYKATSSSLIQRPSS